MKALPTKSTMQPKNLPPLQWLVFIIIYVALDRASYFNTFHGLDITPWNPALPLGLVYWLRYGRIAAIPWVIAMILGDLLIRGHSTTLLTSLVAAGAMVAGYGSIAELMRPHMATSMIRMEQRHLLSWLVIVLLGTLATSFLYISLLSMSGLIPSGEWLLAMARFWVGDCIGIVVLMPFFGMLLEHRDRMRGILLRWETAAYTMLSVSLLWLVFGLGGTDTGVIQYFYLLFLPIVWAAARQGIAGASVAAFVVQAGIIIASQYLELADIAVFKLQIRGAVLIFTAFFIGVIVEEKQRVSLELQRSLRLAAAGEMAGALAHELNQPLSALVAYGSACEQLLAIGETGSRLHDAIRRMVAEAMRAAEVVRSLRDFFRTGATELERFSLADLFASVVAQFTAEAQQKGVELIIDPPPDCLLQADRLQLEVVLRNLLSNAFDAVTEAPGERPRIRLSAKEMDGRLICICVEDSGTGLSPGVIARLFEPFQTTKSSGLGLGLAISRAIVEAHGGRIWAETTDHGLFKLELPIEGKASDAI